MRRQFERGKMREYSFNIGRHVRAFHYMWVRPRFHRDAVLHACAACEWLADFPNGGHGALLSPLPPGLSGLFGDLLNDPPSFNRAELPVVDHKIAAFFRKHLRP